MPPLKNIAGRKFGRLVALHPLRRRDRGNIVWRCQCDCGRKCSVRSDYLLRRDSKAHKSCGCWHQELMRSLAQRFTKHSHAKGGPRGHSPTYMSWSGAKTRCFNPNSQKYKDYGGRGITMCPKWRDSFEAFLADMGEKPEGTSLDRWPNNDGHYEPGNCRWATPEQQQQNKRRSATIKQVTRFAASLADETERRAVAALFAKIAVDLLTERAARFRA